MNKKVRRKLMMKQRFLGLVSILISVLIVIMASKGHTPSEMDATPVLLFLPLGIFLLRTKNIVVH